jgi:hypothetical protein
MKERASTPKLEIRGRGPAQVGRSHGFLQDVHVGKEFVSKGNRYQMLTTRVTFSRVAEGDRFRLDGKWYIRSGENTSHMLDPNMPLADPCAVIIRTGDAVHVDLLEVHYRGADESVRAAS